MLVKEMQMTMLDTPPWQRLTSAYRKDHVGYWHGRAVPVSVRPARGALAYRGTGIRVSCAPHRPRRVSASMTIVLAGIAALVSLWLVTVGQSRVDTAAHVPEQLAVVQVQPGENLQRLATRVAPDAPVSGVVERIRELNELESAALDAGQTIIAPVG